MEYEYHYSRFPTLKSYIDRIGAEQLNFRRFMVKEYHGSHYYVEKVLIKITDDYEIECNVSEYSPTEEEAAAIAAELAKVDFPKSIAAGWPEVDELLATGQVTGQLFIFPDNARKVVLMCQERREKDGKKYYVPWSLFKAKGGSGVWRQMEPDGKLPFWKPKVNRHKAHFMVHEGAKTAAFVDGLINDPERRNERKAHPWAEELAAFEHWGAIGGAMAIHRCDYEELRREKLEGDLFYVCDRDAAGEQAAPVFSKMWGNRLYAIKFDHCFREGWDLADKLPEALYSKIGTVNKTLMSFKDPATWATKRMEKKEGAGRPGYRLTKDFINEWVHTINPEMFCHARLTNKKHETAGAFNSAVRPFSDIDDTSRLLKQSYHNKAVSVKYDPAREPGVFQAPNGNLYLNTYIPSPVLNYSEKEAKHVDCSMIDDFFDKLFPVAEERNHVKKWVATLIAKSGLKMNYGLLLVSEVQGVGKSTLCHMIAKVLGESNVSYPNESLIIGNFNDYAAEKQFAQVSEIYQGHSTKAYNQLKEVITDKTIAVNRKYVAPYIVDNHLHVIACSNSMRALRLDNSDRRWFIPQVNQAKHPHEYWTKLHDWLDYEDGFRKFKLWAQRYERDNGHVEAGAEAPWTFTKKEMIEENDTPGMEFMRMQFRRFRTMANANGSDEEDIIQANGPETSRVIMATKERRPLVIWDGDIIKATFSEVYNGKQHQGSVERPLHARKIAKEEGWFVGKERVTKPAPGYRRAFNQRALSTSEEVASQDPNELTCEGYDSQNVCLVDMVKLARELADL
jgi:hypothetical protein